MGKGLGGWVGEPTPGTTGMTGLGGRPTPVSLGLAWGVTRALGWLGRGGGEGAEEGSVRGILSFAGGRTTEPGLFDPLGH